MILEATFASVWDDGAVKIENRCQVDFDSMTVTYMAPERTAWIGSGMVVHDDREIESITETIEHLDEEYIELDDGQRYTAVHADSIYDSDDEYGHGIVTYR